MYNSNAHTCHAGLLSIDIQDLFPLMLGSIMTAVAHPSV